MAVQGKKVLGQDLTVGMYVSALDRPWIETNYMMEGFYIESGDDINKLQSLCQFVIIDIELTRKKISGEDSESSFFSKIKSIANTDIKDINSKIISIANTDIKEINSKLITIASTDIKDIGFSKSPKQQVLSRPENKYKKTTSFANEFRTANKLYKDITMTASQLFNDAHTGNTIDLATVRRSAAAVVDSVVRNPDAFLWLTRLHEKDTHSHNRSLRTSIWSIAFARYLGLSQEQLNNLSIALLLCNIGKAKLPKSLLEKEDNLNDEERREYQKHVDLTLDVLKVMGRTPQAIITIIRAHCERYNGSGYPMHLRQDDIPLLAQIAGLVTYYEAITNRRVQENSLDSTRAVELLFRMRDTQFMAELIEEFICSIGIYPVGSIVELNSKEIAIIVEQHTQNHLLPQVLILRDINRQPVTLYKVLDLYEINSAAGKVCPKIINTYALGTFGIDVKEVTQGLARATQEKKSNNNSKGWGLKSFLKKMVS